MKQNIVSNYVKNSLEELSKVTWPTKNQAVRMTVVVLGFCIVLAVFLGVVDYLFSELYSYVVTSVI